MPATSDFTLFARFLIQPEDSGIEGFSRRIRGTRSAALLKTVFWLLVAVGGGLALGRLG
ncbi:hypothetical protein [Desulfovibrio aminophilus]|uniref:hypothetical protein n=1 Tax=Desulfovibrio aminophilus TaxID=81425 RepID=UPI003395277B